MKSIEPEFSYSGYTLHDIQRMAYYAPGILQGHRKSVRSYALHNGLVRLRNVLSGAVIELRVARDAAEPGEAKDTLGRLEQRVSAFLTSCTREDASEPIDALAVIEIMTDKKLNGEN